MVVPAGSEASVDDVGSLTRLCLLGVMVEQQFALDQQPNTNCGGDTGRGCCNKQPGSPLRRESNIAGDSP